MNTTEKKVLGTFKALLLKRVSLYKMILFGSRARGDATPYTDMDVVVITEKALDERDIDYVSSVIAHGKQGLNMVL